MAGASCWSQAVGFAVFVTVRLQAVADKTKREGGEKGQGGWFGGGVEVEAKTVP